VPWGCRVQSIAMHRMGETLRAVASDDEQEPVAESTVDKGSNFG